MATSKLQPYQKDCSSACEQFVSSLPHRGLRPALEATNLCSVEMKAQIHCANDLERVFGDLATFEILHAARRSEMHHLYARGAQESRSHVYVSGGTALPWIKVKTETKKHVTRAHGMPALSRRNSKYKPHQADYGTGARQLEGAVFVSRFEKDLTNLYFLYGSHVMSLSVSIASDGLKFDDAQAELEYEGSLAINSKPPCIDGQLEILEQMVANQFPSFAGRLTNETKLEKLLRVGAACDLFG